MEGRSTKLEAASNILFLSCAAGFVAITLFVMLGPGSAIGIAKTESSAWNLQVSLTSGFAITTLAYAVSKYSNQINSRPSRPKKNPLASAFQKLMQAFGKVDFALADLSRVQALFSLTTQRQGQKTKRKRQRRSLSTDRIFSS